MKNYFPNPVYDALLTGDAHLSLGTTNVKYFDLQVSPFVGFDHQYNNGFSDLYELLPGGRNILYATPSEISTPPGWQMIQVIHGLQFIYDNQAVAPQDFHQVKPLTEAHVVQMMQLAQITRPGPFGPRTIDFGQYHGIFEKDKLVAMTGQRLHLQHHTEISAVCTLPECAGKGYARTLLMHQVSLILQNGHHPFLHVRNDNYRAIDLYQRSGFAAAGPMNFYFMKRA